MPPWAAWEVIMNKAYSHNQYESNCRFVRIDNGNDQSTLLDALGELLSHLGSVRVLNIIKVILALACFVGFIGVMGGVESGNISLALGMVISAFMIFIEILCFAPRNRN